jgi:hypothetical protein
LRIAADPGARDAELDGHVSVCANCRAYRQEMLELDADIRRALDIDVAPVAAPAMAPVESVDAVEGVDAVERVEAVESVDPVESVEAVDRQIPAPDAVPSPQDRAPHSAPAPGQSRRVGRSGWRGWALAASLIVTIAAGTFLGLLRPADALAADVVAHALGEPDSWSSVADVPPAELDAILQRAGVRLDAGSGDVVYARTCEFRGREIPHLVVRTADGPVTVLVLAGERVAFRNHFSEEGFTGVLVPAGGGSLAVLSRGDARVDEAARLVMRALHWQQDGGP